MHGVNFRDATIKLSGSLADAVPVIKPQATASPPAQPSPEWIEKAKHIAYTSHERLFSTAGQMGADYLLSRGLEPPVWQRFGLGFRDDVGLPSTWDSEARQFVHPPQPAIVIPWHNEAGQVRVIRYRFLQQQEYTDVNGRQRQTKQKSEGGSQLAGLLYGWRGLLGGCARLMTLLICEGELNSLSIWQAQHDAGLDVLSLGSESQRLTPQMVTTAQQYANVIVWADRNDVAWELQQAIPGAYPVKSPDGQDANDLLKAGKLGAHLAGIRYEATKTIAEREGLLWDLCDSASVDTGTVEAIHYIAKQLGKQVSLKEVGQ